MKRLILGIIAGLLTTAALSSAVDHILHTTGIYPPYGAPMFNQGLVALAFTYRAVFSVFGVYVASRIAQSKSATAARTLGIVGAVIWLAGAIAFWNFTPAWYNVLGILVSLPLALAGERFYRYRLAH